MLRTRPSGIEQHAKGSFRAKLETRLDGELRPWFGERILEVDEEVILEGRRMVQRGKAVGHNLPQPGLSIAATAAVCGLTAVTGNFADFALAGVPVFDPWTGEIRS